MMLEEEKWRALTLPSPRMHDGRAKSKRPKAKSRALLNSQKGAPFLTFECHFTTYSDGDLACALGSSAYIYTFPTASRETPVLFKRCRLSGLVVEHVGDTAYALDDGTGVIQIVISDGAEIARPAVGDYIEAVGQIQWNIGRTVTLLCSSVRNDPMEEVRHLLEQAAFHRDLLRFKQSAQQRFLSSDPAIPNGFDRLTDVVSELLGRCDRAVGMKFEQVQGACEDDADVAHRVIRWLQKNGIAWSQDDTLFPL